MCGILGIYGSRPSDADLERAIPSLVSRGPDVQEKHEGPHGILFAARLKVVDIRGEDCALLGNDLARIAYNGEVFNHRQLRQELLEEGVSFRTERDTETLLHVVTRWGIEALSKIEGQFAFILEYASGKVIAARDGAGVCPLWYCQERHRLLIGSTIEGLSSLATSAAELRAVPQGHYMVCELPTDDGHSSALRIKRYLPLPPSPAGPARTDLTELRSCLLEAIAAKVPHEVPYATIVGGIDSSFATAVCASVGPPPLCTVTVVTPGGEAGSDARNARAIARRYGTKSVVAVLDEAHIRDSLRRVVRAMGSAHLLSVLSACVALRAAEVAREHGAKVLITGGGADEIFGGYTFVWTRFPVEDVPDNLMHIYRQTGSFECHREDAAISLAGIEPRPAYFNRRLERLVLSMPVSQRLPGLNTGRVRDKALLRELALNYSGFPQEIAATRKQAIFASTSVTELFRRFVAKNISSEDADAWFDARMRNTTWQHYLFGMKREASYVHRLFCEEFPSLSAFDPPLRFPNYDDVGDYGRYHNGLGMPLLQGRPVAESPRRVPRVVRRDARSALGF